MYWKIAPGENASQWEQCRNEGFISVGWKELGDLSGLTHAEFIARRDKVALEHEGEEGYTRVGLDQAWKFSRIEEGDRIVANRGIKEVVGIGTVTGPYYFVPAAEYGHRLPVAWDDCRPRRVSQPAWLRTLIELDATMFEEIVSALPEGSPGPGTPGEPARPPLAGSSAPAFSERTFELLAELHENPTREFYLGHKTEFTEHVEQPIQRLFRTVVGKLPRPVVEAMETERNVFARILKNDWGRGGAWDFYWAALYLKGRKRVQGLQLFIVVFGERLEYGFWGELGSAERQQFMDNWRREGAFFAHVVGTTLDEGLEFGHREQILERHRTGQQFTWQDWVKDPAAVGIRAAVMLPAKNVLSQSLDNLSGAIARDFARLFPLVLFATLADPVPSIRRYLEEDEPESEPVNSEYSLADWARESAFDETSLARWVRAIERKGQAILYGPPGTGKTYMAERLARHLISGGDGVSDLIQFHPSYAYEDFIQGIRPSVAGAGALTYEVTRGRFLEFCGRASERKGICVLIIDEINRANLSRVLGELMYLLEYRKESIPLAGGGRFTIPDNVRIIGTMNTADRSIALVDHALRRRFAFLELRPNFEVLRRFHKDGSTGFEPDGLIVALQDVNRVISNPHFEIGISFFLRPDLAGQIEDVWRMEIEPYLEEYFFDQESKVAEFRWEKVGPRILRA